MLSLSRFSSRLLLFLLTTGVVASLIFNLACTHNNTPERRYGQRTGQQALIIRIRLATGEFGTPEERKNIYALESELISAVQKSGVGEFDGNEFGAGYYTFYAYGASSDKMYDAVTPVLSKYPAPPGSHVTKKYGESGTPEQDIPLGAQPAPAPAEQAPADPASTQ
jgi:hypothetical protein